MSYMFREYSEKIPHVERIRTIGRRIVVYKVLCHRLVVWSDVSGLGVRVGRRIMQEQEREAKRHTDCLTACQFR